MRSIVLLRLLAGGLLAGHGVQQLRRASQDAGFDDTPRIAARAAGGSEVAGGILTMTGRLSPIGPLLGCGALFAGLWLGARGELLRRDRRLAGSPRELVAVFEVPARTRDARDDLDAELEAELEDSFPASDPVSFAQPATLTPRG